MASYSASMKRSMFSLTWIGWSEVWTITRSSGRYCLTALSGIGRHAGRIESICWPSRMFMPSVMARLRFQLPSGSRQVRKFRNCRRALVGARNVNQVAQINRAVRTRNPDDDVPDGLRVRKQSRRIDVDVSSAPTSSDPAGQCDVLRAQGVFQLRWVVSILRQPLLGVVQVDLLRQNSRARDLRHFGCALQSALDQVRDSRPARCTNTWRRRPPSVRASVSAGSRT